MKERKSKDPKRGMKKDLSRFVLAHTDLVVARYAWQQCNQLVGSGLHGGPAMILAFTAFVAAYGRAFTGEENPLPRKSPWVLDHERVLHEYLMDLRHEMVAHTNRDRRRVRLVPPGHIVNGKESRVVARLAEFDPPAPYTSAHVDERLDRLVNILDEKAIGAYEALMEHCGYPVIAEEMLLSDF